MQSQGGCLVPVFKHHCFDISYQNIQEKLGKKTGTIAEKQHPLKSTPENNF